MDRKLKKSVLKNLDGIHKYSLSISKSWGIEHIPLTTFKEIIEKSKVEVDSKDDNILKFTKDYNELLNIMFSLSEEKCKEMNTNNVNVKFIGHMIKESRKAMFN